MVNICRIDTLGSLLVRFYTKLGLHGVAVQRTRFYVALFRPEQMAIEAKLWVCLRREGRNLRCMSFSGESPQGRGNLQHSLVS